MKKFFKLFIGRFFWLSLIIILEIAIAAVLFIFSDVIISGIISRNNLSIFIIGIFVAIGINALTKLFFSLYILNTRVNNQYKITWLIVVNILFNAGLIMYLMFGNKNATKRTKKQLDPIKNSIFYIPMGEEEIEELRNIPEGKTAVILKDYLERFNKETIYNHTQSYFFPSGEDAFPAIIGELKKAKHYIFLEYFIVGPGKFWNSVLEVLLEKVKEGVDVRVIYDDVGSIGNVSYNYDKKLQKMGIPTLSYRKFKPFFNTKVNNRNHRKILVIDGHTAFSGGINLADEYINEKKRFGYWKDNAIMLKGKAVYALTLSFLSIWCPYKGDVNELKDAKYLYNHFTEDTFDTDGYVLPYSDLPYQDESMGENVYLKLISQAKKSVYISTPYFIIPDELLNEITNAALRGVDVKLLTPHIPDKPSVFQVTRSFYKPLIEAGAEVYEYTPGFNHEKVLIVDGVHATLGTINFDYRSLFLNLENNIYLFNASCIKEIQRDFLTSIGKSEHITEKKYMKLYKRHKLSWAILRIFAPLL